MIKSFFTDKAGASFYGKGNYTVVYHRSVIEIVLKLQDLKKKTICYMHIYMSFCENGNIMIYANWNDFLRHLDSIKDMAHFAGIMKRPCPGFYSLLAKEHPAGIKVMDLPEYSLTVIGKNIYVGNMEGDYSPMALPFREDITDAILKLTNDLLDLCMEIRENCPLSLWRERLNALWS